MHLCERARPVSNVLQHFDPCQVILDCTLLCRMSVALFVLTEPPTHQLIKSADTVPPLRNSPFFPPSPSKRNFFLMPQNDVKDQRRHVSRQRLLKWRAKCSSKRRIKISILSRKYCSDFLDLEIYMSLFS